MQLEAFRNITHTHTLGATGELNVPPPSQIPELVTGYLFPIIPCTSEQRLGNMSLLD
jgi:hypothetical protein